MAVRRPSKVDLLDLSERYHLQLTEDELDDYHELVAGMLDAYDALDQFPDPVREVTPAVRIVGERPSPEDDPLNAIVRRCSVKAAPEVSGPLSGKRIGLKDTVAIAGIPMTCASRLLNDYTPDIDATIVKRIIEAGGHITAVMNTDDFGFAGTGHTSIYGVIKNPVDPSHSPGGSSGGSAAAIATNLVDIAIGGDQGGSIRIPAAWCGIVGHKPTHGLVPYTGIVGLDLTIDHTGPMAKTVDDCALLLSVIAGKEDTCIDPRQPDTVPVQDYTGALSGDVKGLKIGVVTEGFGHPESMAEVDSAVREAVKYLGSLGAEITEVSIPEHMTAVPIWLGIIVEGSTNNGAHGLHAYQTRGWYNPRLMASVLRSAKVNGGDSSPTVKLGTLVGQYLREQYHGTFYARAQNMARVLTGAYNRALEGVDLLLMPTTPMTAHDIPPTVTEDRITSIGMALNMAQNTSVFDVTGHPSISVPCRDVKGLPVGLMLTGRHFDDATVLRAGHAYMAS